MCGVELSLEDFRIIVAWALRDPHPLSTEGKDLLDHLRTSLYGSHKKQD